MREWEAGRWTAELDAHEGPLALYVHTPLCGTCAVARRMLEVAEAATPGVEVRSANLNLMPGLAERFRIESVPCLLTRLPDGTWRKVYRFGSVMEVAGNLAPLRMEKP
ncbi:thioredoxin family protein [Cohnella nanjingensis]|uniref:Thioredoxin family protein n=1 Tax=Cohnella nanjingensis TaxID=1387779 RepID=A0A7X0VCR2_9BACL|nr:thioredoxin family protein [Cohnella nanjingensis]MBB6669175.1 thioredoxin family protein [Cohnella nanjingensis]